MANTAGNLGTTWGWGLGENNWKAANDKNLRAFDALIQCHIIERVLTTPPASPADGDCYIPAGGATGAWTGHIDEIACWNASASAWEFWVPRKGWEVFNESDNYAYRWNGVTWAGCNFSFAQLDLNYYKRNGESAIINTTGGFSTNGITRIESDGRVRSTGRICAYSAKTAAYTVTAVDHIIGISGTTVFNVLLPAAAVVGTEYIVKRRDANTTAHTVTAGGTTTIDGATTFTFSAAWQVLRVVATAANAYSIV